MKKQILTLIIGILIGAIITTGIFLIIKGNTSGQGDRMNRGDMQEMDGGFQGRGSDSSRPEENNNRKNSNEQINNNSNDIYE